MGIVEIIFIVLIILDIFILIPLFPGIGQPVGSATWLLALQMLIVMVLFVMGKV